MRDVNGNSIEKGDLVQILCEVIEISEEGVRTRILNSEQELMVTAAPDEVLADAGELVASSELAKFSGSKDPLGDFDDAEAEILDAYAKALERAEKDQT